MSSEDLSVPDDKLKAGWVEALEKMRELNLRTKSEDYNSSGVKFTDYYPEGLRDLWLVLHGKVTRLESLVGRGEEPMREPNHESIEDNAIDLAGYALWFASYARKLKDKKDACSKSET